MSKRVNLDNEKSVSRKKRREKLGEIFMLRIGASSTSSTAWVERRREEERRRSNRKEENRRRVRGKERIGERDCRLLLVYR